MLVRFLGVGVAVFFGCLCIIGNWVTGFRTDSYLWVVVVGCGLRNDFCRWVYVMYASISTTVCVCVCLLATCVLSGNMCPARRDKPSHY